MKLSIKKKGGADKGHKKCAEVFLQTGTYKIAKSLSTILTLTSADKRKWNISFCSVHLPLHNMGLPICLYMPLIF